MSVGTSTKDTLYIHLRALCIHVYVRCMFFHYMKATPLKIDRCNNRGTRLYGKTLEIKLEKPLQNVCKKFH